MIEQRFAIEMAEGPRTLDEEIEETAALLPEKEILEDVNRKPITFRKLMVGVDLFADEWVKLLDKDEREVGVLLPNVNAAPVVLLSLWKRGRTPVVLNYTSGPAVMLACVRLSTIRRIVTSRAFVEAMHIDLDIFTDEGYEIVFLEDIGRRFGAMRKLAALARRVVAERFGGPRAGASGDETAVILFTSGSENVPKGVRLSHRNILANIRQVLSVTDLLDGDRVMNCLPLFHSFGLTVGLLLPLVRGLYTFLYVTPLRYRVIPSIVYDRDCTILLSTNTFLAGYARKAHAYDFRSLRYLFAGAEKLQAATAETWARRFGVRIMEGYGATECAPCISLNTAIAPRHGSVGRLLPGMDYCLEPVEMIPEGGRLFVKGPNVMQGYLNADANAAFRSLDGWYDTGDIVKVDDEGFIHILGRQKRFAKVSGEMVSLTAVEEALANAFPKYGLRFRVAVVTRPCENRGEALVAVTNEPRLSLEEIRAAIKAAGLSNLCRPGEVRAVREIPKLGSGKTDYRGLDRLMAEEEEGDAAGPRSANR
jgi:acyl-[acyl-carrier-protein]-phospholipid O-acyltransferase/long-chain-fatty-acid--[acyl-carrier-protein] ligase